MFAAVKQQQPIDTEAATLGDNDMLGDDKHDYFAEISGFLKTL